MCFGLIWHWYPKLSVQVAVILTSEGIRGIYRLSDKTKLFICWGVGY